MKRNTTFYRRRAAGLCAMCGIVKCETFRCEDCNVKSTSKIREIRQGYLAAGLCGQCGQEKQDPSKRHCDPCRGKLALAARRKRQVG